MPASAPPAPLTVTSIAGLQLSPITAGITTVISGASSSTQNLATAGISTGDTLIFAGNLTEYLVFSITDSTHLILGYNNGAGFVPTSVATSNSQSVTLIQTSVSTANTAAINAQTTTPGSYRIVPPQGLTSCIYYHNASLVIGNPLSGVDFLIDDGVQLKLVAQSNCTQIINNAYNTNGGNGYSLSGTEGTLVYPGYTAVTTGVASNDHQTLNSISGMSVNDLLTFYVFGNSTQVSITGFGGGNVVILSSKISTTTNQAVHWQTSLTGGGFTTKHNFTTVTSGQTSATQQVGSTTGMLSNDYLVFAASTNTPTFVQIDHVQDATHVVLKSSIVTVTSQTVTWSTSNGTPVSWTDQFPLDIYVDLTGTGYTNANVPQGAAVTLCSPIVPQSGVVGPNLSTQVFVVSSAAANAGAVYTNNGQNFFVQTSVSGSLSLTTWSSGTAQASGTLTRTSAASTGDATISFSSVSASLTGGTSDGAFTGTFMVEQTPANINSVFLRLRTQPSIGPNTVTGVSWQAKSADVDPVVRGGTWNPNIQNQTYGPVKNRLVGYFVGTYRADVSNMKSLNTGFWMLQQANSCKFTNIKNFNHPAGTGGGPGVILMQGFCCDLVADNSATPGSDDGINQQTWWSPLADTTNFAQFGIGGMGVNTVIRGYRLIGSDILAFPNHPAFPIVGFSVKDCKAEGATGGVGDAALKIFGPDNTQNIGGVSIYDYSVTNFEDNRSSDTSGFDNPTLNITCQGTTPGNNTLNMYNVTLDNLRGPNNPISKTTAYITISNGGGIINGFALKNSRFILNGTVNKQRVIDYTGSYTVKGVTIADNEFIGITAVPNNLIFQNNGTGILNRVDFIRNKSIGCGYFAHGSGTSSNAAGTFVTFRDNYSENFQGFVSYRWSISSFCSGNSWSASVPGTSFAFVPQVATNSPVLNLFSGGGMLNMPATKLYSALSGCTVNFNGNCVDMQIDLSIADVVRGNGAMVWNNNAALGTLANVGPVVGDATATTGSWHLMSNPLLVY